MTIALPRLHAVTDERIARRPDLDTIARALVTGAPGLAVHARGRTLTGREHHTLAMLLRAVTHRLFVNSRLDVALAVAADGVQLGQGDLAIGDARRLGPRWLIGRSVHSPVEARAALADGADYLVVGPVFATATHPDAAPLGVDALRACVALGRPVVAIGGITPERVAAVRAAGAAGVAAIRALWDAPDPAAAAHDMDQELR